MAPINGILRVNAGPRAVVEVDGTEIECLIDTGAPVNVIDENTYKQMRPRPRVEQCDMLLFGYQSKVPVEILGKFIARVKHRNRSIKAEWVVVKGKSECLVCYSTATELQLVAILSKIDNGRVEELRRKFPSVFSDKVGRIRGTEIKLEIDPNVRPVRQKLRPIAFHLREAVEAELLEMVKDGIIERVDESMGPTEWVSNIVVVPKSTTPKLKIRITCDSRALNKAILRTHFPGKTIEDVIYLVNGSVEFSKLDIRNAFHQLVLAIESRNLTTITTHIGLFRYVRLHMGVSCASEIFAEVLREMLSDIPGSLNIADDIMAHGRSTREHEESLCKVLAKLDAKGATLNVEKCEFFREAIVFFGLKISKFGISPTEDRCKALREAVPPLNAKELRSFLGLAQYSSRFIQDFATIAEPLWKLTKKSERWRWTEVEQEAMEKLKTSISTKAMSFFDKAYFTILIVDASPVGLGAVLTQVNPESGEDKRIVAFASRLLTDVETRYSQCEKEALAVVWGCKKFWVYLYGKRLRLVTDNRAIQAIFLQSEV
jgi:hypothetical protein